MTNEELNEIEASYKKFANGSLPDRLFLLEQVLPRLIEELRERLLVEELNTNNPSMSYTPELSLPTNYSGLISSGAGSFSN